MPRKMTIEKLKVLILLALLLLLSSLFVMISTDQAPWKEKDFKLQRTGQSPRKDREFNLQETGQAPRMDRDINLQETGQAPRNDRDINLQHRDPLQKPENSGNHLTTDFWRELFSFVPYGLMDCGDLFKGQRIKDLFPPKYFSRFQNFSANFKKMHKEQNWRGYEGFSANYPEKHLALYKLIQAPFIRNICETGFNAGHSAFTWLGGRNDTKVYSFEKGGFLVHRPMAEYLQKMFPGRLELIWGDSTKTLPEFIDANPDVKCDFISIDGGHTTHVAQMDYNNFRKMASPNNIVVMDDFPGRNYNFTNILGKVWDIGKRAAEVAESFHCTYFSSGTGFSVGRFVNL